MDLDSDLRGRIPVVDEWTSIFYRRTNLDESETGRS